VPRTVSVRVEGALDGIPLDWARVDGSLSFAPDVDTALAVRTLVVTERGRLTIGSVAEPVRPEARLVLPSCRGLTATGRPILSTSQAV
jgi:hypothetical protein